MSNLSCVGVLTRTASTAEVQAARDGMFSLLVLGGFQSGMFQTAERTTFDVLAGTLRAQKHPAIQFCHWSFMQRRALSIAPCSLWNLEARHRVNWCQLISRWFKNAKGTCPSLVLFIYLLPDLFKWSLLQDHFRTAQLSSLSSLFLLRRPMRVRANRL